MLIPEHSWKDFLSEAIAFSKRGEFGKAEQAERKAIALCEETLGSHSKHLVSLLCELSAIERSFRHFPRAEALLKQALSIGERVFGSDHPEVAAILYKLSSLYRRNNRYGEAEWLLRRVLACLEQTLGKNHRHLARVLNNLAGVCSKRGNRSEAALHCRRALLIIKTSVNATTTAVDSISESRADDEFDLRGGLYEETESIFSRVFAALEDGSISKNYAYLDDSDTVSKPARIPDPLPEDKALYQHVREILETSLGPKHPDIQFLFDNFATTWRADLSRT